MQRMRCRARLPLPPNRPITVPGEHREAFQCRHEHIGPIRCELVLRPRRENSTSYAPSGDLPHPAPHGTFRIDASEVLRLPSPWAEIVIHENLHVPHKGTEAHREPSHTQKVPPWALAHLLVFGRQGVVLLGLRQEVSGFGVP